MRRTEKLIAHLARDAAARPAPHPLSLFTVWFIISADIGLVIIGLMGHRPDLGDRLHEPLFLAEVTALILLIAATALSTIWSSFPDCRQQAWLTRLPLIPLAVSLAILAYRLLVPAATPPTMMVNHNIVCGICITLYALFPAFLLMHLIRRNATTRPYRTGALALLTAAATGHLVLKFIEANDHADHLIASHLPPIGLLGLLGLWLGKKYLAW